MNGQDKRTEQRRSARFARNSLDRITAFTGLLAEQLGRNREIVHLVSLTGEKGEAVMLARVLVFGSL